MSSRLFNERSYDIFLTISVISAAICAIAFISSFSSRASVKMFRPPTRNLTNDICIEVNLTSLFLWLEGIILQSSELSKGIDKGQLLGSKNLFYISFEVVW